MKPWFRQLDLFPVAPDICHTPGCKANVGSNNAIHFAPLLLHINWKLPWKKTIIQKYNHAPCWMAVITFCHYILWVRLPGVLNYHNSVGIVFVQNITAKKMNFNWGWKRLHILFKEWNEYWQILSHTILISYLIFKFSEKRIKLESKDF